ncbi:hypothetical protein [Pseudomonas faucium]|uniref:hypothetical protein n=1 Tax=Pseudomonas faucium TaxID=2740518 RepID=UPI0039C3E9B1
MIDLHGWPTVAKLFFGITPFVIALTGVGIGYHLAGTRHFGVLCSTFKNSPGLIEALKYWSTISLATRSRIVAGIALAAVCPKIGVRQGWLNAEDYRDCPRYLKRRLQISFWCLLVGCGWLLLGWALIEISKL